MKQAEGTRAERIYRCHQGGFLGRAVPVEAVIHDVYCRSLQMFPRPAVDDAKDDRLRDAEPFGQLALAQLASVVQRPDLPNLLGGHLRFVVPFAARTPFRVNRGAADTPLLLSHIEHVVFVRAEEQMIGANAAAVVAGMQNEEAIGNRAVGKYPSQPMGSIPLSPKVADAIAVTADGADKFPAVAGSINHSPEPGNLLWGILGEHDLNLLDRFGECHRSGLLAGSAGALRCPNYTMGKR